MRRLLRGMPLPDGGFDDLLAKLVTVKGGEAGRYRKPAAVRRTPKSRRSRAA